MFEDLNTFFTESANKQRLLQAFWLIAQVRYITFQQLKTVKKPWVQHIATKTRLKQLSEMDYLDLTDNQAYTLTSKSFNYLKNNGFNINYLQKRTRGEASNHTLKITEAILKFTEYKDFFTVFYPNFTSPPNYDTKFLEPDACLVFKRPNSYKLTFLEVENPKFGWQDYLFEKKEKYETIASDYNTYDKWWRYDSQKLNLPLCEANNFCFSILCIGGLNYDWRGWEFRTA